MWYLGQASIACLPACLPLQAYSAARMAESTLLAMNGEPNIYECAYVASEVGGEPAWQ